MNRQVTEKRPVELHPLTENPTAAWQSMEKAQKVQRVKPLPLDTPIHPDRVRFVCISDTHSMTSRIKTKIPDGDVLLHAGDFTRCGTDFEISGFNSFLESQPHKHKIVIAGNHELSFDSTLNESFIGRFPMLGNSKEDISKALKVKQKQENIPNAVYLEDSSVTVYGIKIYGTPWQPEFCSWAFNVPRGSKLLEKWNMIPDDTDVLLTHTPPLGHGDLCVTGVRAGCCELLSTVQNRVKPKFHVFGHIHEGYGMTTDGQTIFINSSICTAHYTPSNPPVIFDLPLPAGQSKSD